MSAKNDRFKKLYEFYGIHGEYMHALTSPSDDKGPALFSSGIELFRCAAVVGVLLCGIIHFLNNDMELYRRRKHDLRVGFL